MPSACSTFDDRQRVTKRLDRLAADEHTATSTDTNDPVHGVEADHARERETPDEHEAFVTRSDRG